MGTFLLKEERVYPVPIQLQQAHKQNLILNKIRTGSEFWSFDISAFFQTKIDSVLNLDFPKITHLFQIKFNLVWN